MYSRTIPTTDGGLWFCTVLKDGRPFCLVAHVRTEEEASRRADHIAGALNAADEREA